MSDKQTVTPKSWDDFRESGLAWFINSILHLFGWAIIFEVEEGKVVGCYPGRVIFRGFDENSNTEGYQKITKFLKDNIGELQDEANA